MNKLTLGIAAAIIGTPLSLGSAFGTVKWLDDRYAPLAAVEDVQWTALKGEIRTIREKIAEAEANENEQLKAQLELDLQDTIDRLCKAFPDDRICKS
jgi:hypothetical protein